MPQIDVMKLCEYFEKSTITKFEYSTEKEKIVLEKQTEKAQQYVPLQHTQPLLQTNSDVENKQENQNIKVKAPLVGVFYAASAPGEKPFVTVGQSVKKGQTLCLLEAMKMMSEVLSPIDGVIKKINCANEDVVGFDDVLFEVL